MKKWFKFCEERTTTISVSSSASCDADSLPAIEINIDTRKLKPCPPGHYLVILNKNYIKNKNFSINLFFIWDLWPFYTFKSNDDKESATEDPFFILGFNLCIYDMACHLLYLSSWLSLSPDLLTTSRGQRHSRGLNISMLSIFYIQLWSSREAIHLTVLVTQLRSTYPPQANTVSCLISRTRDTATPVRRQQSVAERAPLSPAWHWLMTAGREQLHC